MILHDYKAIHVHIPKCAGMSIEEAFGMAIIKDKRGSRGSRHFHKSFVINKFGSKIWNSYFKFAFVRNPWERFVSLYFFRKKHQRSHIRGRSFKACMMNFFKEYTPRDSSLHFWIMEGDKQVVDFVGRFENLHEDFAKVCSIIGANVTLNHINKTNHTHYSHYYDDECLQFVTENCKRDIELFGYTFEDKR